MSCPEHVTVRAGAISVLEGIALVSLAKLHHAGRLVLFGLLLTETCVWCCPAS